MNADFIRLLIDYDLTRARELLQNLARFGMTTALDGYNPVTDVMRRLYQQLELLERGELDQEVLVKTLQECSRLMDEADARLWDYIDRNNPAWQAAKAAAMTTPLQSLWKD